MAELVKGLIYVREPLALVAFLGLVLLAAFRTKKVPELFFGLVRDKLTRQHFSLLLSRFMYLGFAAFLVLGVLAFAGQYLNSKTQPGSLTLDDLRRELSGLKNPQEDKLRAEASFATAIALIGERDFEGAIASLQKSLAAIPTQEAAQEMLAFLYRQTRKFELSNAAWVAAKMAAEARGDSFAVVRLDRIGTPRKHDPTTTGDTDLIGASTPLPPGGGNLETAPVVPQGLYLCTARHYGYLKIWLKGGQQLFIHFRQADDPNGADLTAIVHDTNGERKALGQVLYNRPSGIASVEWTAPATGWHFVQIAAQANSVFRVTVRD